jgi:hypothetical protein
MCKTEAKENGITRRTGRAVLAPIEPKPINWVKRKQRFVIGVIRHLLFQSCLSEHCCLFCSELLSKEESFLLLKSNEDVELTTDCTVCEDGRCLVSASYVTISNPGSVSSTETRVNPGLRIWKKKKKNTCIPLFYFFFLNHSQATSL